MRKILQIDGGGLKGIIPAIILDNFEKQVGKQCCDVFDLICGTSTGAIIGGILASGTVPASIVKKMYIERAPKLFTPRVPIFPFLGTLFNGSKYSRNEFIDLLKMYTGNKKMKDLRTLFMTTTMNLCSGRTHFVYSDDIYEKEYLVSEVISWSALSAALYFGKINVPEFIWDDFLPDGTVNEDIKGGVFQDGGQGINNCTLGSATAISIAKKWFDDGVVILSLGCGDYHNVESYKEASKIGWIGQLKDFFTQARNEAQINQYMASKYISITRKENYTLIRVNCFMPKKADVLDGVKYVDTYRTLGEQLKDSIPFELFK